MVRCSRYSPSVACSVDSRERNTAIEDFEIRLVLQHQGSHRAGWNRLGEGNDGIMCNDRPFLKDGGQCGNACCSSKELNSQRLEAEKHFVR